MIAQLSNVLELNSIVALVMLIFIMTFTLTVYIKLNVKLIMLVTFVFSFVIGVTSLTVELPFYPFFQIFFLIFQTTIFILSMINNNNRGL